jgi:hypothetical protein
MELQISGVTALVRSRLAVKAFFLEAAFADINIDQSRSLYFNTG